MTYSNTKFWGEVMSSFFKMPLFCTLNVFQSIKLRRLRWAGYAACGGGGQWKVYTEFWLATLNEQTTGKTLVASTLKIQTHYCSRPALHVSVNVDAAKSSSPSDDVPEPWVRVFRLRCSPKHAAVRMFQDTCSTSSLYTATMTASMTSARVSSVDALLQNSIRLSKAVQRQAKLHETRPIRVRHVREFSANQVALSLLHFYESKSVRLGLGWIRLLRHCPPLLTGDWRYNE